MLLFWSIYLYVWLHDGDRRFFMVTTWYGRNGNCTVPVVRITCMDMSYQRCDMGYQRSRCRLDPIIISTYKQQFSLYCCPSGSPLRDTL